MCVFLRVCLVPLLTGVCGSQGMFGYLDKASMELRNMPAIGTELGTVQKQIQDLKVHIKPACAKVTVTN